MITFSHFKFTSGISSISVTLTDPNPPGLGEMRYEIVASFGGSGPSTPFATYRNSFPISQSVYPEGFGIRAYVRNVLPEYESSPLEVKYAPSSPDEPVFGGHLDLDTSTTIAAIARGYTEAHTHDYTGKYKTTTVDYFNLRETKQIEINEAISDRTQKFKITVVNGDLSPGLRLSISFSDIGGGSASLVKTVSEYDNYSLNDLAIFSLGSTPGARTLEKLVVHINEDAIISGSVIPTNTGDVKSNVLGKKNEWRNGALTVQAVAVNPDGSDGFTTDTSLAASGGVHGAATSGLLWESTLFWHWGGDSYHQAGNTYQPSSTFSISEQVGAPGDWRPSDYLNDR